MDDTKRSYFPALTIDAIEQTNQKFSLGVPIVEQDGVKKIEFRPAPRERWRMLKLLDDDYLTSSMTTLRYSVNSKRQAH